MNWIIYLVLAMLTVQPSNKIDKEMILSQINELRAKGCNCGGEYQPPVGPLKWNDTLYKSALSHAKEMNRYNFFSHYSKSGKDVGQRISTFGYPWQVVGENIGEGQRRFDQVLKDWRESKTHCMMLMDKRVDEVAVAKHKKFWVQHFGKQFSKEEQTKRTRSRR